MLEWILQIYLVQSLMQPMLSVVTVRGGIWHAGHALAREQVSYPAFGERIVLITVGNHRTPDIFSLNTPKRAHFLKSGRRIAVHIFVYQ